MKKIEVFLKDGESMTEDDQRSLQEKQAKEHKEYLKRCKILNIESQRRALLCLNFMISGNN